jgi:hypothetical protein
MEVDVSGQKILGRPGNWFVVELIRIGRKLAVETMREEGRHILGVSAEEGQTADVVVILVSDEKAGNGAAGLLQEFQEIGTAWRVVNG